MKIFLLALACSIPVLAQNPNPCTNVTNTATSGQVLSAAQAGQTPPCTWISGSGTGTVTHISTTAPITGGPITTTGTIGCSNATTGAAGCVKPDGTTITVSGGVISAVSGSGTVTQVNTSGPITGGPITGTGTLGCANATTSATGCVQPDGTTVTISGGVISAAGGGGGPASSNCSAPTYNAGGTTAVVFSSTQGCANLAATGSTTLTITGGSGYGPYYLYVSNSVPTASPLTYPGSVTGACQPDASSAGAKTSIELVLISGTYYPVSCSSATAGSVAAGSVLASNAPTGPPVAATQTNIAAPWVASGTGCGTGTNALLVNGNCAAPGSGSGTVTSVSVTTNAGVSGTVATATTTPAISLTLGNITPTSVATGTSPPACTPGTGGCVAFGEGTVPSVGAASAVDVIYANSTQHGLLASFNNGSYLPLVQGPASTTSGHLADFNSATGGLLADSGVVAANVVTSAASLTSTAFVTGAGSQGLQTPSATSTLSSGGNASFAGTVSTGGSGSGEYTASGSTSGSAAIGCAAVCGSSSELLFPIADPAAANYMLVSGTPSGGIDQLSWMTIPIVGTYGGTGVNNGSSTITLAGNLVTTGAFNTTFAQAATTTVTLPSTSATMARTDAAQTFTGVQTLSSAPVFSTQTLTSGSGTESLPGNTGGVPIIIACATTSGATANCANTATGHTAQIYFGKATLATNSSVITISPGFTSATTYYCEGNDVTTRANPVQVVPTSATTLTITDTTGASDAIQWVCTGY